MPFDEVLDRCIAAIEQGTTVDECLALYPAEAEKLAPLLRTVSQLRSQPPLQLSAAAFQRGRAALAAQARHHQRLAAPFLAAPANSAAPMAEQRQTPAPSTPLFIPSPSQSRRSWLALPRWGNLLASILVVLTLITTSRNVLNSVPGSELYLLKQTGEQLYGYFMSAAGQEARWHTRQLEHRLYELDRLARQGATDEELVAAVEQELQQALAASAALPEAQREAFFARWLADLRAAQPGPNAAPMTTVTLGRIMATVEAAADAPPAPLVLDPPTPTIESTPEPAPSMTATTESLTVSPTLTEEVAQPFISPTPSRSMVQLPTVTPTQLQATRPTATPAALTPAVTPSPSLSTATATLPPATTTQTATRSPADDDDEDDRRDPATASPLPPTVTETPAPGATATLSASPTDTPDAQSPTPTPDGAPTVTTTPGVATETVTATTGPIETDTPAPATPTVATDTPAPPLPTETVGPTSTFTPAVETPEENTPAATQSEEPTRPPETPMVTATEPPQEPEDTPTPKPAPTEEEETPAPTEKSTEEPTPPRETLVPDETPPVPVN